MNHVQKILGALALTGALALGLSVSHDRHALPEAHAQVLAAQPLKALTAVLVSTQAMLVDVPAAGSWKALGGDFSGSVSGNYILRDNGSTTDLCTFYLVANTPRPITFGSGVHFSKGKQITCLGPSAATISGFLNVQQE